MHAISLVAVAVDDPNDVAPGEMRSITMDSADPALRRGACALECRIREARLHEGNRDGVACAHLRIAGLGAAGDGGGNAGLRPLSDVETVERGPIPAVHGVVRWRVIDLVQWLWDEFSVSVSKQTLSRELRALGYRKLSARPKHHAQDAEAIEAFKKGAFPPSWIRSERVSRAANR